MISYALVILTHHPKSVPNMVINSTWTQLGMGTGSPIIGPEPFWA